MQINLPGNLAPALPTRPAANLPWVVNQLLSAQVIGQPRANYTRLDIAGRLITARTELPLITGQKLALRVAHFGPIVVLKVLSHVAASKPTSINRVLPRVLPGQSSLPETIRLWHELGTLARSTAALPGTHVSNSPLTALRERATEFLRALPLVRDVTSPITLRAAVKQTAIPTEAKLYASTPAWLHPDLSLDVRWLIMRVGQQLNHLAPEKDFAKPSPRRDSQTAEPRAQARLLRTASPERTPHTGESSQPRLPAVESTAADLRQLIDGAVARIQANQLQNLPLPSATTGPLVIELPIARGTEVDLLRFEYVPDGDAQHEGEEKATRRARLTISLHMGQDHDFTAEIRLAGTSMNIRVGSNNPTMNALLERRLDVLRAGIERHGFDLSQLVVGPVEIRTSPRSIPNHLVDDRI